ncbi:MAG: hypothetical protein ABJP48_10550 [Erythrobacter sp.]
MPGDQEPQLSGIRLFVSQQSERLLLVYCVAITIGLFVVTTLPQMTTILGFSNSAESQIAAAPLQARDGRLANGSAVTGITQELAETGALDSPDAIVGDAASVAEELAAGTGDEGLTGEIADNSALEQGETPAGSRQLGGFEIAPLDFTLSETGGSIGNETPVGDDAIEVRKTVFVDDVSVGSITITIDQNAQLFIQGQEIRGLLANQPSLSRKLQRVPESGLVSFERLRDLGMNLRYVPTTDSVMLNTG